MMFRAENYERDMSRPLPGSGRCQHAGRRCNHSRTSSAKNWQARPPPDSIAPAAGLFSAWEGPAFYAAHDGASIEEARQHFEEALSIDPQIFAGALSGWPASTTL